MIKPGVQIQVSLAHTVNSFHSTFPHLLRGKQKQTNKQKVALIKNKINYPGEEIWVEAISWLPIYNLSTSSKKNITEESIWLFRENSVGILREPPWSPLPMTKICFRVWHVFLLVRYPSTQNPVVLHLQWKGPLPKRKLKVLKHKSFHIGNLQLFPESCYIIASTAMLCKTIF